jgi:hypothetical protein
LGLRSRRAGPLGQPTADPDHWYRKLHDEPQVRR